MMLSVISKVSFLFPVFHLSTAMISQCFLISTKTRGNIKRLFLCPAPQVAPSVAYDAATMNELRKWNEQYGEGGSRRKSPFGFWSWFLIDRSKIHTPTPPSHPKWVILPPNSGGFILWLQNCSFSPPGEPSQQPRIGVKWDSSLTIRDVM